MRVPRDWNCPDARRLRPPTSDLRPPTSTYAVVPYILNYPSITSRDGSALAYSHRPFAARHSSNRRRDASSSDSRSEGGALITDVLHQQVRPVSSVGRAPDSYCYLVVVGSSPTLGAHPFCLRRCSSRSLLAFPASTYFMLFFLVPLSSRESAGAPLSHPHLPLSRLIWNSSARCRSPSAGAWTRIPCPIPHSSPNPAQHPSYM